MAVIARIRPFARCLHSSQFVDDLANGDICLALAVSGASFQALHSSAGLKLEYVVPKEGRLFWLDVMAIPADALHVDNYPPLSVRSRLLAPRPETSESERHRLRLWSAMKAGESFE